MSGAVDLLVSTVVGALAGHFTQHQRVIRLTTSNGVQSLLAETLRGEETIGSGFRFELSALSLDAAIPLKSLVGQPVLVELLTGSEALRPFHGHVTAAELTGSNGGFARYRLVIEPWTAFLRIGRDSRIFQDKSVIDILEAVFKGYDGKGRLAPAWRFDLQDPEVYPRRSITTQYQESDMAFVERLMSEEGLFCFFEHEGNPGSAGLGKHTLVIADHNDAFAANAQPEVRFTQPGAVMREDSLDRWRMQAVLQTNAVELASWDYRSRSLREVASAASGSTTLTSRDHPGAYAYQTRKQGERIAERQLQALQARQKTFIGAGTVRTFAPGTTFTLLEHGSYDGGDDARFTIVRVCHMAHNNLNADTDGALTRLLGQCLLRKTNLADLASSLHAVGRGAGERPVYRNRIDAIPAATPYRGSWLDERGHLLHPRPLVRGQQTAIVVGPAGSVIHTDRDHRIKVQFHWQRGSASHSRLEHPVPEGHTGAPADDQSGTWVRVATPLAPVAGANWGSNALPRVGQEVLIDFLEGNIDRPVVIGTLHNGAGQADAQNNGVAQGTGAATGNAPAWFPGESGAHAHPAALSGIKSQAMQSSQDGTGAFSQLVFDDSPNEPRIALQRHAKPHEGTAELNLGHLRHQTDNQRLGAAGFGAELKTAHSVALRAARGLLLSTEASNGGSGHQLDSGGAQAQNESSARLQLSLAETAQKHNARLQGETEAAKLPALVGMQHSVEVLQATEAGMGEGDTGGQGQAAILAEPQLQLSAPAGIVAVTPASAIVAARATSSLTAGQDINIAAQADWHSGVKDGISLFTYGKADAADKPNKETGIALHAASGKVSVQSHADMTKLTADKLITVASVGKSVTVAAKDHVMLTAQGAYIKLEGGNIMIHGPGTMSFKASSKELGGPANGSFDAPELPSSKPLFDEQFVLTDKHTGEPMAYTAYRIEGPDGVMAHGVTDKLGHTDRISTGFKRQALKLFLDD
ncbi:type VI secretion system Vgr family protein [Pseudoduganella plicata]|uniref:Type VI secretion system tip protein VgrG n=1 Tax=Pseudoduganella plicata TaxID=321984 RepID=A0A4P7BJ87_9BURK|nr:type VI secretion system Vgr family protein [Pseudoduganella plicata]QBQ38490.1 type VI secretion system tip protein VgrG [Pseudoduganella plicata]GGY82470.1 hypothetical protein GCM10007388_14250 [Pseudoduganella plicata]